MAASIDLFGNVYFNALTLGNSLLIVAAGLVLGASSFVSLILGGEIEYVINAGQAMVGTILEKGKDKAIDNELNKSVSLMFFRPMKRINRIRVIFWSDIFLIVAALGITTVTRVFFPLQS